MLLLQVDGCSKMNAQWFEVRNLAIMNERKGRISPTQTVAFLRQLKLPTILTDYSAHSDATLRLARTHKLTVYDAAYLELALRRKVELATLDKRLAEAAQTEGVIVVV